VGERGSIAMRPYHSIAVLLLILGSASCARTNGSAPAQAGGKGKVTIVYKEEEILPENREAMGKIMASGVFQRMAGRVTEAVALPHDIQILVSDKMPAGVDVPTDDGRTIYWPAAFARETHEVLSEFVPEVVKEKGVPKVIPADKFTADTLNMWGNQFILGHEMGHALIHELEIPVTGHEEDSADGFASFFTANDPETGPNAALGAAVLFDAMGSKNPALFKDYSSDHPIIVQRVYNFLCALLGKDPAQLRSLVTDGYVPESRAMMCEKEWAQLNYGWWTVLGPHLSASYKKETEGVRQQARKDLEAANDALSAKLKEMRKQQ
jgi:hypothetical protein